MDRNHLVSLWRGLHNVSMRWVNQCGGFACFGSSDLPILFLTRATEGQHPFCMEWEVSVQ